MPSSAVKKSVGALIATAFIAVLVVLCLPVLASTQIVRDSVAQQVSAWSGYRVRLDDAPEIRVWPSFKAILNDVVLSDWSDENGSPVMEAERVEIDLSALAALRGNVVFTKIRLVRPAVRLDKEGGVMRLRSLPNWGRLAQSVEVARELLSADPAAPDKSLLPSDSFAVVEIEDGRLVESDATKRPPLLSSVSGTFNWPALNRAATLSASGIWHGESITIDASTEEPLFLLAGGKSALSVSLESSPLTLSFKGEADLMDKVYVNGRLESSAPSLQRMLEWTTLEDWPGSTIKPARLSSLVSGDTERVKFEDAQFSLGESNATGVFAIAATAPHPTVSGTLAFNALDLGALLTSLAPDTDVPTQSSPAHWARKLNFDLRLSSSQATAGSISMENVAATAQVRDGLVSLDISDAAAFGGTLQFGVRLDNMQGRDHAELRIAAENVDGGQMGEKLHFTAFMPSAKGSFTVFLKGHGETLNEILETSDGSISASFGAGQIAGLNLETFREHNDKGSFFPLQKISDGALQIEGAELKATLAGGIAWIDTAVAHLNTGEKITLGGLVPFAGRGIALSGSIIPPEAAVEKDADAGETDLPDAPRETFFVGGSWNAPFIAPFLIE
ncbi:AsmA family protein [Nitratireductor sp. GISD-1A_MAKvit]|uniref:AsmA family protein n=1 Tax=Nitratireductor sp. GISD-1A_MAKvit TaxID=3234198 RepID=UPI003467A9D3